MSAYVHTHANNISPIHTIAKSPLCPATYVPLFVNGLPEAVPLMCCSGSLFLHRSQSCLQLLPHVARSTCLIRHAILKLLGGVLGGTSSLNEQFLHCLAQPAAGSEFIIVVSLSVQPGCWFAANEHNLRCEWATPRHCFVVRCILKLGCTITGVG